MSPTLFSFSSWRLGRRLSFMLLAFLLVVLGVGVLLISARTSARLESVFHDEMQSKVALATRMMSAFEANARQSGERSYRNFESRFEGAAFALSATETVTLADAETPLLTHGGRRLNGDFESMDRFTHETGVTATIFARKGDDFVRVTTSVKKQDGSRAVGTLLDRKHPAWPLLRDGGGFTGRALLFGKPYMTHYQAIRDAQGRVIGALYTGEDISGWVGTLQGAFDALKVGRTGRFYAIDAKDGNERGRFGIAPPGIAEVKDDAGRALVERLLREKSGRIDGPLSLAGLAGGAFSYEFRHEPGWNWIVVAEVPAAELNEVAVEARTWLLAGIGGILLVLVLAVPAMIRRVVTRPIEQVSHALRRLAEGELRAVDAGGRQDEIGALLRSLDEVQRRLGAAFSTVAGASSEVATMAEQIARGNADLSARNQEQAASLQQAAASLGTVASSLQENAEAAARANTLSAQAAQVARRGGEEVGRTVSTMEDIAAQSRRITDIVGVIDGIAFQTNILALNAAVEAARAGESGRGFAVVAAEVRALAKRSADAAREIGGLIAQTVQKVESGSALVAHAGATINEIVQESRRVSELVASISQTTAAQSDSIGQMHDAVTEIDRMTQQNAALVEQSAEAAQRLHQQAGGLQEAASSFRHGG